MVVDFGCRKRGGCGAQLGLAKTSIIVLGHLTEAQRRAYCIADNKITELGDDCDALLADADNRPAISDDTADAIPELPAEPITRPGNIWQLGQHRLRDRSRPRKRSAMGMR